MRSQQAMHLERPTKNQPEVRLQAYCLQRCALRDCRPRFARWSVDKNAGLRANDRSRCASTTDAIAPAVAFARVGAPRKMPRTIWPMPQQDQEQERLS